MAGGLRTYTKAVLPPPYARRRTPAARAPSTPPVSTAAVTAAPLTRCSPVASRPPATLAPRALQVLFILLVTCGEMAIVLCYFQLCNENYMWQWRAFLNTGSAGLFLFGYRPSAADASPDPPP